MQDSHAAEIEILKGIYAGINRNDIPAIMRLLDDDFEWTEPSDYPYGGTTRGRANIEALFTNARATWAEGTCEPEEFIPVGNNIVVFDRVHVRLHGQENWIDGTMGAVYTVRDGRAIRARIFSDRQEALEWAATAPDPA